MLSKEMEEKLGFDKPKPEKKPKERGKSILKKSSLLSKEDLIKGNEDLRTFIQKSLPKPGVPAKY